MTDLKKAAQQALEALLLCDSKDAGKAMAAITFLRDALAQQAQEPVAQMRGNALARWAHEQEEPPDTDWQRGYEAARRWVRQVGLPSLAQQTQTSCDIAEDGVCEVIDCCRNSTQILEALEIGYAAAQAEAAQYHAAMAGYRLERHAAMDADVAKIAAAITALRAALAQPLPDPVDEYRKGFIDGQIDMRDRPEGQEPVLVVEKEPDYMSRGHFYEGSKPFIDPTEVWKLPIGTKLYTAPPRREWQRLTNEEMYGLYRRAGLEAYYPRDGVVQGDYDRRIDAYARAVEAALKEKNHG